VLSTDNAEAQHVNNDDDFSGRISAVVSYRLNGMIG